MTKKQQKKKSVRSLRERIFRAAIITIAVIFLVYIFIQLSFVFYFNNKVRETLQAELYQQTKGEYKLSIKKIKTNLFNQSIYATGVVLTPDKTIETDKPKYYASAEKIKLVDFKLWAYLFHKDLIFDNLKVKTPVIKIYRSREPEEKKSSSKKYTSYEMIKKSLHSLTIKEIKIKNADINFYDDIGDSLPSIKSRDNILRISNLKIKKVADKTDRWFLADSVSLTINKFNYETKSKLYTVRVKKLVASSGNSSLTLDSLQLIPNYDKKNFGYMAGKQTDRISITVYKAAFTNMNIKLLFERNSFIAENAIVDRFTLDAYRDKNVDPPPNKNANSLQQLIKSIPFNVNVNEIKIKNADVVYEEVPNGAVVPGRVSFDKINGVFKGLTNDKKLFTNKSFLTLNANCLLMNKGRMIAHYDFPLNTDSMEFDCSAKLTDFPLDEINPTLEPLAYITMKEGTVDTLVFNFHADEKESNGKMELRYHDLKIKLLKNDDVKNGKVKDFFTLPSKRILVILLVKKNNPTLSRDARVTEIHLIRDPYRFIFNYSWKSILSGVKPSLGMPAKTKKIKEPPPK